MKLIADLHTHTVASGHAYSTLEEMARAARDAGLVAIAVTDHGPNIPGGPHRYYFGNLRVIPDILHGVAVLKGVEANIINYDGELDLPPDILGRLDFVMAGFHIHTGYDGGTVEENTRAMIRALNNPYVDAVSHPGNPAYPVDIEAVVSAAMAAGKLIEINNSSLTITRPHSDVNCFEFARVARRLGARVVVGSDAHISTRVGGFDSAIELITRAGLTEEYVVNSSITRLQDFFAGRGKNIVIPSS
ncbi:MAG TPA: phosphatase [Firmicutes bacterium]|nr:phosphatase [Bacillota bacterium]